MIDIKFYWDEQGYPHADAPEPYQVLGGFLEEDIQIVEDLCKKILEIIDDIQSRRRESWHSAGNSHLISLSSKSAKIESLFEDPPQGMDLSLKEFRQALEGWQTLIRQSRY